MPRDTSFHPESGPAIELSKTLKKLIGRIERIIVPVGTVVQSAYSLSLPSRLDDFFKTRVSKGEFYYISTLSSRLIINWDAFDDSILPILAEGHPDGANFIIPQHVRDELGAERHFQIDAERKNGVKEKMRLLHERNGQPLMPGKWRKEPYPKRAYQELQDYSVTQFVEERESDLLRDQLNTSLEGFLGQAYNYDDHGLTEEWMVTFSDEANAPSDDEIIRVQCSTLLEILTAQVQDKVCNDNGVLKREPVGLYSGKLKESQVWGIDCFTRKMIEIAIEDRLGKVSDATEVRTADALQENPVKSDNINYTGKQYHTWLERILLPSINAQSEHTAHNMGCVTADILEKHASGQRKLSELDCRFTQAVSEACVDIGIDSFRIHPKGTGVICTAPNGIEPHILISEYLGDIYPPYRWCERLDVVEQAQEKYSLKPTLPDFYNILLERPRQDMRGYGLLFVDASQKCNMGSSCSHSCAANTSANVVARNGKLTIALTTNRHVHYGEELTMDYSALTTSDIEWRAAICLCGTPRCRGSFLHYATQDDLQQVLQQNCGPLLRYSSLLKSCIPKPCSTDDQDVLNRHGIKSAVLEDGCPHWMRKYAADNLRFLEFERKALPCALMRPSKGEKSLYTFAQADADARSVMEQRLQSLVCCLSMQQRVIREQPNKDKEMPPLCPVSETESAAIIWSYLQDIPKLIKDNIELKRDSATTLSHNSSDMAVVGDLAKCSPVHNQPNGSSHVNMEISASPLEQMEGIKISDNERFISICKQIKNELDDCNRCQTLKDVQRTCLNLRNLLLQIEDFSSTSARLNLLADLLVLWAHTSNFSMVHDYTEVVSQPISVVARDLGMCVEKSKVHNVISKRFQGGNAVVDIDPVLTHLNAHEGTSIDDTTARRNPSTKYQNLCDPNEIVHTSCKLYSPLFSFHQLMSWFNAGTDEPLTPPDITGCVQLPLPSMCFGSSDRTYGAKQREILLNHLGDEKAQSMAWPNELKACFNYESVRTGDNKAKSTCGYVMNKRTIFGSPMLDVALGQVDAVVRVMQELLGPERAQVWLAESFSKKSRQSLSDDDMQLDSILPPEIPTSWIQCEDCLKWRRVPWHIDADALPDVWYCRNNTWDSSNASCDAKQDTWDPTRESTLETIGAIEEEDRFEIGSSRDVYCTMNKCYYVAQIKAVKEPTYLDSGEVDPTNPCKTIKFHFQGWQAKFDEWIRVDSGRIAPLNLYTDPMSRTPAEQERWQGREIPKDQTSKKQRSASAKSKSTGKRGGGSAAKPKAKRMKATKSRPKPNWDAVVY